MEGKKRSKDKVVGYCPKCKENKTITEASTPFSDKMFEEWHCEKCGCLLRKAI